MTIFQQYHVNQQVRLPLTQKVMVQFLSAIKGMMSMYISS